MEYSKIKNVKSPQRGTSKSAGIDFFVPEDFKSTTLESLDEILIESGIKVNIPKNHVLLLLDKSGIASKGLVVCGGVIDEDFQGELKFLLFNRTKKSIQINPNDKIIQGLIVPINYSNPVERELKELYTEKTERGEGGFGSTGNN